jgi:hypothetical protein
MGLMLQAPAYEVPHSAPVVTEHAAIPSRYDAALLQRLSAIKVFALERKWSSYLDFHVPIPSYNVRRIKRINLDFCCSVKL